jgi:hypothetical protein
VIRRTGGCLIRHPLPAAARLVVWLVLAQCGGTPDGPHETRLAFQDQPRDGRAGEALDTVVVTVTDASGQPNEGPVSLEIDDNRCGARLSGGTPRPASGGVAQFEGLEIDKAHVSYRLAAVAGGTRTLSAPFRVSPVPPSASLTLEFTLCAATSEQRDAESLAFVPEDDHFWLADDDLASLFSLERSSGAFVGSIPSTALLTALPEAGLCDDGDGNVSTLCSYIDELESVAYDAPAQQLYVVNTVGEPRSDRPAIFRLHKEPCPPCFAFDAWRPLPEGRQYSASVVVNGGLHLAIGRNLHAYDFIANRLAASPAYVAPHTIVGLGSEGGWLWVLTREALYKVDWATRRVRATHDLTPYAITTPKGIEVVGDTIYLLDGDPPHRILGLKERAP